MEDYENAMIELFGTPGWTLVVADAEEAINTRKERLLSANSIDEVRFIQGEVAQLQLLIALETIFQTRLANEAREAEDVEMV